MSHRRSKNGADDYGFGSAASAAVAVFDQAQRGTGRTNRMLQCCKDGDLIVCCDEREASRLRGLLKEAGKSKVKVRTLSVTAVPMAHIGTLAQGQVWFDHDWQRRFFITAIQEAAEHLLTFKEAISKGPVAGFGMPKYQDLAARLAYLADE